MLVLNLVANSGFKNQSRVECHSNKMLVFLSDYSSNVK